MVTPHHRFCRLTAARHLCLGRRIGGRLSDARSPRKPPCADFRRRNSHKTWLGRRLDLRAADRGGSLEDLLHAQSLGVEVTGVAGAALDGATGASLSPPSYPPPTCSTQPALSSLLPPCPLLLAARRRRRPLSPQQPITFRNDRYTHSLVPALHSPRPPLPPSPPLTSLPYWTRRARFAKWA